MCHALSLCIAQEVTHESNIYKEIQAELKLKKNLIVLSPFKWIGNDGISHILEADQSIFSLKSSNDLLKISIPLSETSHMTVIVKKQNMLGNHLKWSRLTTYRGVIENDPQSWVTINVSQDGINGIIADRYANRVLETNTSGVIEIYDTRNKTQEEWTCESIDPPTQSQTKNKSVPLKINSGDTVTVYIECDYSMYLNHNSDVTVVINYVNSVMNDVAALYQNEQITLLINDIHVWTTLDPYDKDDVRTSLYDFQSHLNENFDADLAMLLSYNVNQSGGVAFVNSICQKDRGYSYSNLNSSISGNNNYSWQTHVIAHELGHNLGSPHTHACEWGPEGNKALDDCYTTSCDVTSEGQRGTIMSYCHLSGQGGVNFSLGFGTEPGDRIRQTVSECRNSNGTSCSEAMTIHITTKDTIITAPSRLLGNGASQTNADRATWYKFIPHTDGHISISSCDGGVDTRLFVWSGTCDELTPQQNADDICDMGNGLNYAAAIDSLAVESGIIYYIEWDDRWSSEGFDFILRYDYVDVPIDINPCSNGIKDEGEEDVDCGGTACIPCSACEVSSDNTQNDHGVLRMRENGNATFNGQISASHQMIISCLLYTSPSPRD